MTDTNHTTMTAACLLGVSRNRIRQLISRNELPAEKFGRDWVIKEQDLVNLKRRKVGRPRKSPSFPQ